MSSSSISSMADNPSSEEQRHVYIYNEAAIEQPVPEDVTHVKIVASRIHYRGFYDCFSIIHVTISSSIQTISEGSFHSCDNLLRIELPASLKTIDRDAFRGCESLDHVELPEGLEVIGDHAFFECSSLRHMTNLPSTLKRVGVKAFASCGGLESIVLPDGLQEVGGGAFMECEFMQRVKISSPNTTVKESAFACCDLRSVELPDGLQVIGKQWFFYSSLPTLDIPASVSSIEDEAFHSCARLTSLDLPTGLISIGSGVFSFCSCLATILIPSTVRHMGEGLFNGCGMLQSISLPPMLTAIENRTFANCGSLIIIRIPPRVTRIGENAFMNCPRLISLELPGGLQSFETPHIFACKSLVNVLFPPTLEVGADPDFADADEFLRTVPKMGSVMSSFPAWVYTLRHRFDDLPLHKVCYYQSYHPTNTTLEKIRQAMVDVDPNSEVRVDVFGMSPFHLLALSQTPNTAALLELQRFHREVDFLRLRDKWGSNPVDYLCLNPAPEAAALVTSWLPLVVNARLEWLGLERWKAEIMTTMESVLTASWPSKLSKLTTLYFKLASLERLESISLLEMALWQAKVDEYREGKEVNSRNDKEESAVPSKKLRLNADCDDRQRGRSNSGAYIVIPNVLQFLDKVQGENFAFSSEEA